MYKICGKHVGCPWEDIDECETREEARLLLCKYMLALGTGWHFTIKKVGAQLNWSASMEKGRASAQMRKSSTMTANC